MQLNQSKYTNLLIHLGIWALFIIVPLVTVESPLQPQHVIKAIFPVFFAAYLFYINYFYLIQKFIFNRKIVLFVVVNLMFYIGFSILVEVVFEGVLLIFKEGQVFTFDYFVSQIQKRVFKSFLPSSLIVGISLGITMTQKWYADKSKQEKLEKEKLKSELDFLKNQLSPHFFFNTLNNIYSLIEIDQTEAQKTIHTLAKLMRYLLYESNTERVELTQECSFIQHYIDLMKIRVSNQVCIESSLPNTVDPKIKIAPLLFISLIENAFKHGIHPIEKSHLKMKLNLEENNASHQLFFEIENSNYEKQTNDKSGSGIGLNNLKKRLELLYPNQYLLEIESNKEVYITKLSLNL